ncbi:hypothetical protein ITP53_31595 [Nonomuraea sp. K274]|uniref:Secreted protein n=1 Tax=Nonomuraea cypriaca TaxID=1187855 RepID=A0A931F217_9ACTN|nr:hypothetical protein [Nonomuraea cypriaca]MBF8190192.1 hypothetical protein [Nonomuraea cypriaca]
MTITRTLAALALTAATAATSVATAVTLAPAAQAATISAATTWGPHYAPGRAAKAVGSLTATGEDHDVIPTADVVRVSGKVYDHARRSGICGWAVFRVTYRDATGNLPFRHHSVRDCSYRTAKEFSFKYRDVYQVDLKVCAAGRTAKPSPTCLYAGTWKILYLSK